MQQNIDVSRINKHKCFLSRSERFMVLKLHENSKKVFPYVIADKKNGNC